MPNAITRLFSSDTRQQASREDMGTRELERLQRKVGEMTAAVMDSALAAQPQLTETDGFSRRLMETVIEDFVTWFAKVNPSEIADDHDLTQMPQVLPALSFVLQRLDPDDAALIREGLCHSDQLWRLLCKLSPSIELNPDAKPRTPTYDAMRHRYLFWVNAVNRDLPQPSAVNSTAATGPTPAPRRLAPVLLDAAREIRLPGQWQGATAEIAPHVVPRLAGWPPTRTLQIQELGSPTSYEFGSMKMANRPPVKLFLNESTGQYSALVNGRKVPTPPNGDSFFRAVLSGLDVGEREVLLTSIGADPTDPFGEDSLRRLREATAQQLESNPKRFTPILELFQLLQQRPSTR